MLDVSYESFETELNLWKDPNTKIENKNWGNLCICHRTQLVNVTATSHKLTSHIEVELEIAISTFVINFENYW